MTRGDWELAGFLERLDVWAEQEQASQDLRLLVTGWILTRYDDPYAGARREAGFDGLHYCTVPGTAHQGRAVVCSYWVNDGSRTVICSSFATLSLPL